MAASGHWLVYCLIEFNKSVIHTLSIPYLIYDMDPNIVFTWFLWQRQIHLCYFASPFVPPSTKKGWPYKKAETWGVPLIPPLGTIRHQNAVFHRYSAWSSVFLYLQQPILPCCNWRSPLPMRMPGRKVSFRSYLVAIVVTSKYLSLPCDLDIVPRRARKLTGRWPFSVGFD